MKKVNVYDRLSGKLVLGENISQTAAFVLSGSADVGIVALSLALSPNMKGKGRYVEVPPGDYPPIDQACVVLKASQKKEAARALLEFVKSPAIGELLRSYGFGVK
jgi:molybdate transport system substrate-binding protein